MTQGNGGAANQSAGDDREDAARRLAELMGGGAAADAAGPPPSPAKADSGLTGVSPQDDAPAAANQVAQPPTSPSASWGPRNAPGRGAAYSAVGGRPRPQPRPVVGEDSIGEPRDGPLERTPRPLPAVAGTREVAVAFRTRAGGSRGPSWLRVLVPPTATLGALLVATGITSMLGGERLVVGELPGWLAAAGLLVGVGLVGAAIVAATWVARLGE